VKAGDASIEGLGEVGQILLKEYPSYEALIDAAGQGEIHVFSMDAPPAHHFLIHKGLLDQYRQAFVLSKDFFHRAVLKGNEEILNRVNQGFLALSNSEVSIIKERWQGKSLSVLTEETSQNIALAIGAALVVIALLAGLVFYFRSQAKKRMGQLAGTEERLKVSEDRFQAMVEVLPDLLFQLDEAGLILECHTPVQNTLYHDPERYVGKRLDEMFPPLVAKEVLDKLHLLMTQGGVAALQTDLEIRGRVRTFDSRIVRLGEDRLLAIVRDISDTRRAWEDDLHRNKLESLALLAGGLAHDFNNSLGVIQGFVSLARLQLSEPEKALASLDKAVQATRRAAGLTSQLRVLAHGSEVHRTLISIKDLAEESAAFALVGSSCALSVDVGDGPWTVEADPDQLSQVFHNLVLNAVQAMPQGGTVTLGFQRLPGGQIAVSVTDQGVGIPAEYRSRIFDPYFTTKAKGTGLGLSVVHAVVKRHGGTLEVESKEGQGTTFLVTFPSAMGELLPTAVEPYPVLPEWQNHRALVMEDEEDLRTLMVEILTPLGFRVTACQNGRDAIVAFDAALAEDRPFALVVSDLLVPGDMGGREMISHLRRRATGFRALAVTGFSAEPSPEDLQHQGFDVIVGKPFTIEELRTRIVEVMKAPWKTAPNT